jgi:hypothetical protein
MANGKPPLEFMAKYKIDSDEVWPVRPGVFAIKHAALERVAAEQGITFMEPKPLEARGPDKCAALVITGKMGERVEWSIGEAAPGNNKNAYPYAMAEKRGKDRVVLKLLNAHGKLYSEEEADDFKQRDNPHVNKPTDFVEPTEYDEQGHPVDNIPLGDRQVTKLSKALARPDFAKAQAELRDCKTVTALQLWGSVNANRIASYPSDWAEMMRGIYSDHLHDLRKQNGKVMANGV